MTIYEYIRQASKEQFQDFCFQLYNKGWNDGTNSEDDENWIFKCLPDITMEEWEEKVYNNKIKQEVMNMKNNTKHIIWSSRINEDDWWDDIKEECELNGVEYDENGLYYMAYELNDHYLKDERANLDIDIPNGIIAIVDLGLWFGRRSGYKEIGNNIADCLYYNTNDFVVFKAWKDGVTDEQKENVMDALYCGKCTNRMLRRYTRNIGEDIAKVYGWNVSTGKKKMD